MSALLALLQGQTPLGAVSISLHDQLTNKTAIEKAQIKSNAIAKLPITGTYFKDGIEVKIISVKSIEGGIEIMARAWKGTEQLGFGKDYTTDIERFRIYNPPILVNDPNGTIVREWTDSDTGEVKRRKLREDPAEAIKATLAHTISVSGKTGKVIAGSIGNTTSTFFPDAGTGNTTVDGHFRETYDVGAGVVWGTIRADAGDFSQDTDTSGAFIRFLADTGTNNWRLIHRGGFTFNTAVIGADTISSATFTLFSDTGAGDDPSSNTPDVNVYGFTPAANNSLTGTDYAQTGSTAFSSVITFANWGATNNFALNASGLTNINGAGISRFSARNANYDVANVAPTWANSANTQVIGIYADTAGTTQDPKLVVVHTAAGGFIKVPDIIIW